MAQIGPDMNDAGHQCIPAAPPRGSPTRLKHLSVTVPEFHLNDKVIFSVADQMLELKGTQTVSKHPVLYNHFHC